MATAQLSRSEVERIRLIVNLLDDVVDVANDRADSALRFGEICDDLKCLLAATFLESADLPAHPKALHVVSDLVEQFDSAG